MWDDEDDKDIIIQPQFVENHMSETPNKANPQNPSMSNPEPSNPEPSQTNIDISNEDISNLPSLDSNLVPDPIEFYIFNEIPEPISYTELSNPDYHPPVFTSNLNSISN